MWQNGWFVTKWLVNIHFLWDILKNHTRLSNFCQTLGLVLRQGVDFVLPQSQEQQQQEQAQMGVPHSEKQVELNWQLNLQAGTCLILNFIHLEYQRELSVANAQNYMEGHWMKRKYRDHPGIIWG